MTVVELTASTEPGPARQQTIVLLTGNSLSNNPRAFKEASALARAGYRVQLLGAWLDPDFKSRDEALLPELPFDFIPVLDMTAIDGLKRVDQFTRRLHRRAAQYAHDLVGWESQRQFGGTVEPLLREALRRPASLYIAHSEVGLCVAAELLRRGLPVGVDMEDWFSEDLLPAARRRRPLGLLRDLERLILSHGVWAACPSEAMATALAETYGCRRPTVIYNAFSWSDRVFLEGEVLDRRDRAIASLYWFSQTIGPGRGIEELLAALPLLRGDCEIHLRGRLIPGFDRWIAERLPEPWRRRRVFMHDLVNTTDLLPRIAEHDIGFAGEPRDPANKDLTVSNKILHYLLGGLAVVASDTKGQQEVARRAPEAVTLYRAGDARDLARQLDLLIESPARRMAAQRAALAAAQVTFCWEREGDRLIAAMMETLHSSSETPSRDAIRDLDCEAIATAAHDSV